MNKRKQTLAVLGVVSVLCASFAMLVYAAAWTPDDMAAYMQNVGRHKIYQTNWILYNEIGPKMAEGLGGEIMDDNVTTTVGTAVLLFLYSPPHPQKVSLYIDLKNMKNGDSITVITDIVLYEWRQLEPNLDFNDSQTPCHAKLILDQLPVAKHVSVYVRQTAGTSFEIPYQVIVEEA